MKPAKRIIKSTAKPAKAVLAVFSATDTGKELFRLECPAVEIQRFKNAAREFGKPLPEFFAEALREKISREITRTSAGIIGSAFCLEVGR